ncbi:unnamed protein product, partial [Cuscuta europaea]
MDNEHVAKKGKKLISSFFSKVNRQTGEGSSE